VAAAGGLYRRRGGKKMGPGPGAATRRQGRRGHAVKRGGADQQWRGSGAADGGRVTQKGHTRGRGGGGSGQVGLAWKRERGAWASSGEEGRGGRRRKKRNGPSPNEWC
jgi:hypothetical protein